MKMSINVKCSRPRCTKRLELEAEAGESAESLRLMAAGKNWSWTEKHILCPEHR